MIALALTRQQAQLPRANIASLPAELTMMILLDLEDTCDLVRICLIYRNFYDVFAANREKTVRRILRNQHRSRGWDVGDHHYQDFANDLVKTYLPDGVVGRVMEDFKQKFRPDEDP